MTKNKEDIDNINFIIVEHLKAIRQDMGDMKEELVEIKDRLTSMENRISIMQKTLDRHDMRFARIEKRLELAEA